jgi:hypothetical protein
LSPSRIARVRIALRSLPPPGSVRPSAPTISPDTMPGNQRFFCSSEPKLRM